MEGPSTVGCCRQGAPVFRRTSPHLASEEDDAGILIVKGQEGGRSHVQTKDRQRSFRQGLCPVQEDSPLAAAVGR